MIDIIDIIARILMLAHAFDWKSILPIDIDSLTEMLGFILWHSKASKE